MKKIKTDDTAIESLKQSGKNTLTGVRNLFGDPKGTFESAAAGVGSLFNRAVGTVGKRETTGAEDNKAAQLIGFSKSKGNQNWTDWLGQTIWADLVRDWRQLPYLAREV